MDLSGTEQEIQCFPPNGSLNAGNRKRNNSVNQISIHQVEFNFNFHLTNPWKKLFSQVGHRSANATKKRYNVVIKYLLALDSK